MSLVFVLSGCVTTSDLRNDYFEQQYSGQVKGNYSALARCVVDTLGKNRNFSIGYHLYTVRVYPDIKRSEVHADAHSLPAFVMVINTTSEDNLDVTIRGLPEDSLEAIKALQSCTNK